MWFLPPYGTFYVASPADWYRISSFGSVAVLLMFVIARLKLVARRRMAFPLGYVFATAYAALATAISLVMFHTAPLPRFMDIFLVGIAATVYFFAISPAAYLLVISIAVSAWILPPDGSFAIAKPADLYRIASFAAVSGLLIFLTSRLKKWSAQTAGALGGN
jgi:K+-sensing histidine kinase KdpD